MEVGDDERGIRPRRLGSAADDRLRRPARRPPRRRLLARAGGPVRRDDARRPRGRRDQGRAPRRRRRHARLGPAVARRRERPTTSGSTATSARSRSTSPTRATASWRASSATRADVLIESFRPGLMASWGLDGDTLRGRNPRLVSCSITAFGSSERAAGLPGYDLLLQAMGGLMSVTGEADGRAGEGRRGGRRPRVRAAGGGGHRGGAGRARAHRRGPPRRGLAARLGADLAAQPGLGLGVGGGAADAARQPPPEHRAVRDLRGGGPPVRGRGRQRPPVRAPVRGGRAARAARGRALRHQHRARREHRRAGRGARGRVLARSRPTHWVEVLRAANVPVGPINDVAEAYALAEAARPASRSSRPTASRSPGRRSARSAAARRGSTSTATSIRAWLRRR